MENIPSSDTTTGKGEAQKSPALVINVYSWATPIIALVVLVIGLVAGYFGRPLISPEAKLLPAEVSSSQQPTAQAQPTLDPETRKQLMDYLVPKVRHFRGDPNAPVTIIEFSDFQ